MKEKEADNMFKGCNILTSLDISNFDTSNVTDMSYEMNQEVIEKYNGIVDAFINGNKKKLENYVRSQLEIYLKTHEKEMLDMVFKQLSPYLMPLPMMYEEADKGVHEQHKRNVLRERGTLDPSEPICEFFEEYTGNLDVSPIPQVNWIPEIYKDMIRCDLCFDQNEEIRKVIASYVVAFFQQDLGYKLSGKELNETDSSPLISELVNELYANLSELFMPWTLLELYGKEMMPVSEVLQHGGTRR